MLWSGPFFLFALRGVFTQLVLDNFKSGSRKGRETFAGNAGASISIFCSTVAEKRGVARICNVVVAMANQGAQSATPFISYQIACVAMIPVLSVESTLTNKRARTRKIN
mmetsp:Transcript_20567/g.33079  ORF Transcript_20567/g.33079 Transcript_20567/m.33079 type:complete len:109 (-) Transcript_20567:182-508(-)